MTGRIGNPQNSRKLGTNDRALGDNPRAQGTNPRALGTNPLAVKRDRDALSAALREVLELYPSDNTIRALECEGPTHPRPCPGNTPTDKQVLKWRGVLRATGATV